MNKFIIMALATIVSCSTFAMNAKCPDVNAMRSEGFTDAYREPRLGNSWVEYHKSKYDTSTIWEIYLLYMDDPNKISETKVNKIFKKSLASLIDIHDQDTCTYSSDYNVVGMAIRA